MKKLFVLFAFVFTVALVSCQEQNSIDRDTSTQYLTAIAKNPAYKAYLQAIRELELNIASGNFDLHSIGKVTMNLPDRLSMCDVPKEKYAGIKGGVLYKDLHCNLETQTNNLNKQVPDYIKLSDEQMDQISKIHDEIEGIDWVDTIKNAVLTRFKN